ncbi:MAG: NAD(P)-dependent oxidoreductase [Candidatus Aenigmarchaeota archaeon]|nr:NAD(P)-dependent oxidoreductase [Candidatus Aenigmarchaeota archaeon]
MENLVIMQNRNVLMTGATGFIGSNLLKRLLKENCQVHILTRKNSILERIKDIKESYNNHVIDLTDFESVKVLISKIKPDVIFHLAAYGTDYRQQNIQQAIDINIKASVNLFEAFIKNKGARFIHTGSCFEYGAKNTPISESDSLEPIGIYNITKASSVQLLVSMAKQIETGNLIVLRLFGAFGDSEGQHRFFPQMIDKLSKNQEIKMTGGEQKRDCIYVEDIIDAYVLASNVSLEKKAEIINIGSGKGILLKDIALIIAKQIGADKNLLQFGALPYRSNEMMYMEANIKKAETLLGWKPKTSLEEGIKKMLNYHGKK